MLPNCSIFIYVLWHISMTCILQMIKMIKVLKPVNSYQYLRVTIFDCIWREGSNKYPTIHLKEQSTRRCVMADVLF